MTPPLIVSPAMRDRALSLLGRCVVGPSFRRCLLQHEAWKLAPFDVRAFFNVNR